MWSLEKFARPCLRLAAALTRRTEPGGVKRLLAIAHLIEVAFDNTHHALESTADIALTGQFDFLLPTTVDFQGAATGTKQLPALRTFWYGGAGFVFFGILGLYAEVRDYGEHLIHSCRGQSALSSRGESHLLAMTLIYIYFDGLQHKYGCIFKI